MINSFKRYFASSKRSLTTRIELVQRAEVKGNLQKKPLDEEQAETLGGSEGGHTDTDVGVVES